MVALCSFVQDMSNNELTTLPKAVGYLCKIIKLNVANNQLQSLPAEIGTMNGRLAAYLYTPRKLCLWWVYCFHVVCPSVGVCVRACVRPSVTFCFLNILKSHGWIFIKPCKHVHICKTNTLDKKVRARGQFY